MKKPGYEPNHIVAEKLANEAAENLARMPSLPGMSNPELELRAETVRLAKASIKQLQEVLAIEEASLNNSLRHLADRNDWPVTEEKRIIFRYLSLDPDMSIRRRSIKFSKTEKWVNEVATEARTVDPKTLDGGDDFERAVDEAKSLLRGTGATMKMETH